MSLIGFRIEFVKHSTVGIRNFDRHLDINYREHHDVSMRTTLTLDDDLVNRLKELARETGQSFKEVTNEVVRRGLSTGDRPDESTKPFRVVPKACGFKPGIDPLKLNQIYDDLEIERLGAGGGFGVHEP
jgi:hypothetical protein